MPKEDGLITLIDDVETQVTIPTADDDILALDHVKIIGVPQLDNYISCLQCKAHELNRWESVLRMIAK